MIVSHFELIIIFSVYILWVCDVIIVAPNLNNCFFSIVYVIHTCVCIIIGLFMVIPGALSLFSAFVFIILVRIGLTYSVESGVWR